ncbi:MAG TPA: glycerol-3-phosphate dehydrogenase/oxidase [Terriglobales bacterium]|nr:glycerol-3-phosphate dehydrogenase/oxidase [Terriglobales bacterium]
MNFRASLDGQHFDVLVIGGGINGVAVARECARAGRRTLLVEQRDFCSGTTSRSTRIIHGGLRYLEQGDLKQVREGLRERERLLTEYPGLVRPLQFLLVLDGDGRRSALAVRAGLWLYRQLGHRGSGKNGTRSVRVRLEKLLDTDKRFSVLDYEDAQCEFPERLVAQWLWEAVRAGCVARNHTEVLAVEIRNGSVTGARLRNELYGTEENIQAKWVINATGPWADRVCSSSGVRTAKAMIGGVRGSHIVLPKFSGAPDAALYAEAIDGRPIFLIPWNEQLLVGTTEVPDTGNPDRARPDADELHYLLGSVQRLFPGVPLSKSDVRYAFSGIRPLPYSPDSNPLSTTRRHFLHDHAADGAVGMISVIGGKLTTAGCVARECAERIGVEQRVQRRTVLVRESDLEDGVRSTIEKVAAIGRVSQETASAMFDWFGERSLEIAHIQQANPQLRSPLCPHSKHTVAEAVYGSNEEFAVTLADLLLRRGPVALGPCWSPECSQVAARKIAAAMAWDSHRTGLELEQFEEERDAFLNPAVQAREG